MAKATNRSRSAPRRAAVAASDDVVNTDSVSHVEAELSHLDDAIKTIHSGIDFLERRLSVVLKDADETDDVQEAIGTDVVALAVQIRSLRASAMRAARRIATLTERIEV